MKKLFTLVVALLCLSIAEAQQVAYQNPPQVLGELLLASPSPKLVANDDCSAIMLQYENTTIPMADMPLGGLFLAAKHINPDKFCLTRERGYRTITLKQIPDGNEVAVSNLPEGSTIIQASWYPKGDKVLIFNRERDGVYLYAASVTDGVAHRLSNRRINTTARKFALWVNDTDFITACVVEGGVAPKRTHPAGPVVQESLGKKVRKRTEQGYLRDDFDAQALKYYFTSQLVRISPSGEREIGEPALYRTISISPDRAYLMIYRVVEPYSNTAKFMGLKSKVTIEDLECNVVKQVKQRGHLQWRGDKPSTLVWAVKAKKDNPDYKYSIYEQEAPFDEQPQLLLRTTKDLDRLYWCNNDLALVVEKEKRFRTISSFKPGKEGLTEIVRYDTESYYDLPDAPVMVANQYGRKVVWTNRESDEVLFTSKGHSPKGQMPKLLLYRVGKQGSKVVWQSKAPYFEEIVAAKDPANGLYITSRESFEKPKNYYLSNLKKRQHDAITSLVEPFPALEGIQRKFLVYKRADGVELTSTVWLPADYNPKRDGELPVLLWAYPRTYKNREIAEYNRLSPHAHPTIISHCKSALFWVTQGYCVMDQMAMPLIPAEGKKRANDTFVEQLVMNAEAAIKALSDAGYGDSERVAVGGHSYGAFMTANLLSHTSLFKAGLALSGAYNRSLTPYGFQNENRNYWESGSLYHKMSPFDYANKLNGAILLVHAAGDENTGTYTIQSERYFQALRGHKKYVRYVELPLDGHRYHIRENVLHYLYEAAQWLDKYVKNAPADDKAGAKVDKKRKK
jgi:dipeptidyl aminopeptidase/acylaminoacyl peptidase